MNEEKDIQLINKEEIVLDSIDSKKIRKIKKRIVRVFFVLIVLMIIIVFPMFFYKKELNRNLLSSSYKKGLFHVHSVFSDGTGDLNRISKAAKLNDMDFVLMTDHGRPNVKCSESTGWLNSVLIIGGSEFSLNCGHLASAGYDFKNKPHYIFPPEPQEAIDDINKTKGISFISHPLDGKIPWSDWDIHSFTGIEILNSYSSAKKTSILNILKFPLQYLFNKKYALLNTISYPKENLKLWDDFNKKGNYLGIYALDAHSKLPITKKIVFSWPSYKAMFQVFAIYVKTGTEFDLDPEISAKMIVDSIRKGNYFSVIEAISSANGFETTFIDKNGNKFDTGSTIQTIDGEIFFKLPFDFNTDILIKKDGEIYKEIKNNYKKELRIKIDGSGVYRSEIFVSDNTFRKLPWILTNPFFIGRRVKVLKKISVPELKQNIKLDKNLFKIEKNNNSNATLHTIKNDTDSFFKINFDLKKEKDKKDFWVALAKRKKMDFSGYSGIVFKTKSDKKRRFWVELRSEAGEKKLSYRHSFLADLEWKKIFIPFDKFNIIDSKFIKIDLSKINALFFAINNVLSYKENVGTLELKDLGLY